MAQYVKDGAIPRSSHLNVVYMCQRREGMGDLQPFLKHFVNGSIVPIRFGIMSLHHEVNDVP